VSTEQRQPCLSSTAEYNREKCKRFYHARKARNREAHCDKQRRNAKAWRQRNKSRVAAKSARLRSLRPEYYVAACKKSRNKLKTGVVEAYGGACPCGITDIALLAVDHVGGGGAEHRRLVKRRCIYRIVTEQGFPPTYRILCFNCNWRDELVRRRQRALVGGRAERAREYRRRLKLAVFEHYGGAVCSSCKRHEADLDVLTIDHDVPCRLGRTRKYSGWRFYELLKSQGYPPGFSVMCFNCNRTKWTTPKPDQKVVT
jgi:hypothetical protein